MFGSENFILSSPLMLIMIAVSVLIDLGEYKCRRKWIFLAANAVCTAAAFLGFLAQGAALSDVLLYLLAVIFARLCFMMLERRRRA